MTKLNLEDSTVNTTISSNIAAPLEVERIWCELNNVWTYKSNNESHTIGGGFKQYWIVKTGESTVDGRFFKFQNETTGTFSLFGIPESYPYDAYLLNMTYQFKDGGFANVDNTKVYLRLFFYGWNLRTNSVNLTHSDDYVSITHTIVIERQNWAVSPIHIMTYCMFLILGASQLIGPRDLRARLTVYLTLFVFLATLFFEVSALIPKRHSLSLYEGTILLFIIYLSIFLVTSIVQKLAINRLPSLKNEMLGLFPVIFFCIHINSLFDSWITFAEDYFWIIIPKETAYYYMITLGFFIAIKVLYNFFKSFFKKKSNKLNYNDISF